MQPPPEPPPPTPYQRVKAVLARLGPAVFWHQAGRRPEGIIPVGLAWLIVSRLIAFRAAFARFAAQVAAGTYVPRRRVDPPAAAEPAAIEPAAAEPAAGPVPEATDDGTESAPEPVGKVRFPQWFNWLGYLLPEPVLPPLRGQLDLLLWNAELLALLGEAPPSIIRRLRSLCWMLGLRIPPLARPLLALPPRPRRPRPANRTPEAKPKSQRQPGPRDDRLHDLDELSRPDPERHRTDPPPGLPAWRLMAAPGQTLWFSRRLYPPEPKKS
jgi:hypothetical protein